VQAVTPELDAGQVDPRVGSGWVQIFVSSGGSGQIGSSIGRVGSAKSDPPPTVGDTRSGQWFIQTPRLLGGNKGR
jgi:hypothetical protein